MAGVRKVFKCLYCHKIKSLRNQKRHLQTHTRGKSYICEYPGCTERYSRQDQLIRHENTHGDRPYKCSFCDKTCVSQELLTRHSQTHTKKEYYTCQYCQKRLPWSDLLRHLNTHNTVFQSHNENMSLLVPTSDVGSPNDTFLRHSTVITRNVNPEGDWKHFSAHASRSQSHEETSPNSNETSSSISSHNSRFPAPGYILPYILANSKYSSFYGQPLQQTTFQPTELQHVDGHYTNPQVTSAPQIGLRTTELIPMAERIIAGSNTGGSNTGGSNTGGSNTGGSNMEGSNTEGSNMEGSKMIAEGLIPLLKSSSANLTNLVTSYFSVSDLALTDPSHLPVSYLHFS
jgi:hypothetical protein